MTHTGTAQVLNHFHFKSYKPTESDEGQQNMKHTEDKLIDTESFFFFHLKKFSLARRIQSAQSECASLWEIISKTSTSGKPDSWHVYMWAPPAGSAARNICLAGNSNCTSTSLPRQTALMYERVTAARSRLFPPSQQSAPPSALEDGDLSKNVPLPRSDAMKLCHIWTV